MAGRKRGKRRKQSLRKHIQLKNARKKQTEKKASQERTKKSKTINQSRKPATSTFTTHDYSKVETIEESNLKSQKSVMDGIQTINPMEE